MAHKSISRLHAFDFAGQDSIPATGNHDSLVPDSYLGSQTGQAASTAVLALDLVLHEMLQQARLTSSATGAAVALLAESGIRRRATAGATAAEIDDYLQKNCKLADACLRTGAVQRCDDTENDARFDAAACRRLGLRAVLICRIQNPEEETVGVIEIFSSRPGAFSDRDVLLLRAIGQRIVDNLKLVQSMAVPAETHPIPQESPSHEIREVPVTRPARNNSILQLHARVQKAFQIDSKLFLLVAAVILSIILGWMLGRTQGFRVKGRTRPRTVPATQVIQPQPSAAPANPEIPSPSVETSLPAAQLPDSAPAAVIEISRIPKGNEHSAVKHPVLPPLGTSSAAAESSPDGVVVFEDPKKDSSQPQPLPPSENNSTGFRSSGDASAAANGKGVAHVPAEKALANLLVRIEPDYPEKVREQKIQGPVILDIVVGKDGSVQGISMISGDPQLSLAAAHAVQQWRFKPWVLNGKPSAFESRVTLNFSLP